MATEETTITELELAEEVLADMVIPVDTSTDTKSVSLKQLRAWLGSSLPTGFILPAVGKINDERFTLLDGKTLSKQGTYGAFCAKVEAEVQAGNWLACTEEEYNADITAYNQCGKFVIGVDYVRIPTMTRFIGATITLSEIGKTYKESLPNIKGSFVSCSFKDNYEDSSGSFTAENRVINSTGGSAGSNYGSVVYDFDASLSSSTYQDGAKVQPDHTKYPYYMVISTEGQTAEVGIDINQVYEDLNLKANSDLSNVASVAQSFKEQSVGWGLPDYTAGISLSNLDEFQNFDRDGYIKYSGAGKGSMVDIGIYISIDGVNKIPLSVATAYGANSIEPLPKGCYVKRISSATSSVIFYPCKGLN